ncbi:hypothetical protein QYF36_014324 [Acer negundo]|nr:hypothetical protein QYF36_014324 [Acer negundo]
MLAPFDPFTSATAAADTEDGPIGFGNGPACFGDGPINEEGNEELTEADVERAKIQRKNKGKYVAESEEEAEKEEEEAEEVEEKAKADKDNDDGSEDLGSLDGSNGEEDVEELVRKFIKRMYHEFNPRHDLQDPVFKL